MSRHGPFIDPELDPEHMDHRAPSDTEGRELRQQLVFKRLIAQAALGPDVLDRDAYLAKSRKHDRIDEQRKREVAWQRTSRQIPVHDMIDDPELAVRPDPLNRLLDAEELEHLLAQLTETQQAVLVKLYLLGFTRTEVATLLDLHPDSVTAIKQSALEELRRNGRE